MREKRPDAVPAAARGGGEQEGMFRNTMRGMLALLLTFVANWLANWIIDRVFGPEEEPAQR